jgi:DUF4097 and DUF4098 domain-containing protein YvlB
MARHTARAWASRLGALRLALLLSIPGLAPLAAQEGRSSIDTTFRFAPEGRVSLNIIAGDVRVSSWDRNEIRIVASTERGRLITELSAEAVRLEVRPVDRQSGRTRYDVTVPHGARVATRAVSAQVVVTGVRGDLSVHTVSGSIDVAGTQRSAELETVAGRVSLRDHAGNATVATVAGNVSVEALRGALDVRTVSGDVRADRVGLTTLRHKSVSGGLDLTGTLAPDGRSEIETHSGNVTLRVPSTFAATVEMQSFSGELNSDFAVTLQPGTTGGRGRRMDVAVNGGGARLAIKTFSGDIFLRKSDAARQEH